MKRVTIINSEGRRCQLAHALPKVTLRQLRDAIDECITIEANSHRERDNVIRDKDAIHRIACFQKVLELLREKR